MKKTAAIYVLASLLGVSGVFNYMFSDRIRELDWLTAMQQQELEQDEEEISRLNLVLSEQESQNGNLISENNQLESELLETQYRYNELQAQYVGASAELAQSLAVPYTAISGRKITWAWQDMAGELYYWTLPVDGYRRWVELPKPNDILMIDIHGRPVSVTDFRPYVYPESFADVIPPLYDRRADERVFAQEAFNIVSQLTVYSEEIGEVPRWPIETLTEAGGDCEDLAILFASLLTAAPYPYEVTLIYMDAYNPNDPQDVNHVAVYVKATDWAVFVECTDSQGWGYYEEIAGWFFEL